MSWLTDIFSSSASAIVDSVGTAFDGVPCGEYAVGIGDVYNFTDKKFYKTDGSLVKTYAEIEALIATNK